MAGTQLNVYLYFNGNANEAISFYCAVFNGTEILKRTFGDSPVPCDEDMKDKIIHAMIKIEDSMIMISDFPKDRKYSTGTSVVISLAFTNVERATTIYNALSNEGTVEVPFAKQFWGSHFGELTDKFGIKWMINVEATYATESPLSKKRKETNEEDEK